MSDIRYKLDTADNNCNFSKIVDAINTVMDAGYSGYMKCTFPGFGTHRYFPGTSNEKFMFWFPKIKNSYNVSNKYSKDGMTISDQANPLDSEDKEVLRVVFLKQNENLGHQFIGIYKYDGRVDSYNVYRRVSTQANVYKDNTIEMLT